MTNREKCALYGNAVIFQIVWFAAILGAKAAMGWPVMLSLLLLFFWGFIFARQIKTDLRLAITGVLIAFAIEPIWIGQELVVYASQPADYFPPLWIVALWTGFAVSFNHSLRWLRHRYLLGSLLGCIGSVCSITAASQLGAVAMPQGWFALVVQYAAGWAVIVPLLIWYSASIAGDQHDTLPSSEHSPSSKQLTPP